MRKNKIRILHVAQAAGGVDRYIRMLLKYLDKDKFENVLVCSQDFHKEDYNGLVDYFEQIEMTRAIGASDLKATKAVRKLIKKYNPDIVYAHSSKAGYVFGVGSTLTSFIVLGNYSMGMQVTGKADFIAQYLESGDLYGMIVSIIKTMPGAPVIMVVVLLTMIAFYATSFDSIALTASCYSYHTLEDGEQPNKGIQLMWCILLILLPVALLFAESSMNNLQSVSIVAAFPIGAVIVMIAVSFMKDARKYMEELGNKK